METDWAVTCQAPPSMGFFRQEYWSELPFLSPGDLPDPGIEPTSPVSPAWQMILYPLSHPLSFCRWGITSVDAPARGLGRHRVPGGRRSLDSGLKKGSDSGKRKRKEERAFQEVGECEQGHGGGGWGMQTVSEGEGGKERWNQGTREPGKGV